MKPGTLGAVHGGYILALCIAVAGAGGGATLAAGSHLGQVQRPVLATREGRVIQVDSELLIEEA